MAMTLRLDENREAALTKFADETHQPKTEVIVTAIDEYLARKDLAARTEKAFAYILERDAELLGRLADA